MEQVKLENTNFVHWLPMWSISLWINKLSLKWVWSRSHAFLNFGK